MIDIFVAGDPIESSRGLNAEKTKDMLKGIDRLVWIDVEGPKEEEMAVLAERYNLHPLSVEDCFQTNARPKAEDYPSYLFIVVHAIRYEETEEEVAIVEVEIFVGHDFVITVHERPMPCINLVKGKLAPRPEVLNSGPALVAHAVIDAAVDDYFPVLEHFEDRIDDIEEGIFGKLPPDILQDIFNTRRSLMRLRRAATAQRELLSILVSRQHPEIDQHAALYFRDVFDHVLRISDAIDTYRDVVSGAMDSYLSSVSNRMNHVMQVLSAVATLMMPLTFLTGVYGMNFAHMPGLESPYGFAAIVTVMAGIAGGTLFFFRKSGWI